MHRLTDNPSAVLAALSVAIVLIASTVIVDALWSDATAQDTAKSPVGDNDSVAPTLVGRQVCKECHADNFRLHSQHGHASTFHRVQDTDLASKFAGKEFDGGADFGKYQYSSDADGNLFVTLPSRPQDKPFPLQYALGSGLHAQTMLTLVPGRNGGVEGIEHRATCYSGDKIALTPGHSQKKPGSTLELFGSSAKGEPLQRCVYCHTTRGTVVGESVQDLIANVNCEKCHGPGSEHVRQARLQPNPPPFSIGKSTWDAESELQLCGDCHRLPRSVTEKEIRDYPDLLVRFQPVGHLRSRCYLESDRQLRCTTCHNPHQSVAKEKLADHIQNCLNCHQPDHDEQVACPVDPKDGCIECHMPAIELDSGLKFHDHWIRVRRD